MSKFGFFVMLLSSLCVAQGGEGSFGISGSFVLPVGDFADDDGNFDQNGYALAGFGGGVDFGISIVHPSVELLSSTMLFFNLLDREELGNEELPFVDDLEGGNYFSIPILFGPRLRLPVRRVEPYAMAQAGLNILIQTELEGTVAGAAVERSFETAVSFAYAFGGGLIVDEALNIGMRFILMGEPEIDYETTYVGDGEREFTLNAVQFFIGYQF